MKKRIVIGPVFLLGAVSGIAALLVLNGKDVAPKAEVEAAPPAGEPGKDAPKKIGPYTQLEASKARTVGEKYTKKLGGQDIEWQLETWATRSRQGGDERYYVAARLRFLKGVPGNRGWYEFSLLASDAEAVLKFVNNLKGKKVQDDRVESALIQWAGSLHGLVNGIEVVSPTIYVTYTYDGKFLFAFPNTNVSEWILTEYVGDRLPAVLEEGLKEVEKLKAAPWSPTP